MNKAVPYEDEKHNQTNTKTRLATAEKEKTRDFLQIKVKSKDAQAYGVGGEGDLAGVEDLLVDDNRLLVVRVVGLLVLGSSGQDGGGDESQGGNQGGSETHVGWKEWLGGWIGVKEGTKRKKDAEVRGLYIPFEEAWSRIFDLRHPSLFFLCLDPFRFCAFNWRMCQGLVSHGVCVSAFLSRSKKL